jgi:hypothetical protein
MAYILTHQEKDTRVKKPPKRSDIQAGISIPDK